MAINYPDNVDRNPELQKMRFVFNGEGQGLNILSAWQAGYTGKGIIFGISESGIAIKHPDLDKNYQEILPHSDPDGFYAENYQTGAQYKKTLTHGTPIAGIIAAENNGIGGIGISYNAKYDLVEEYVSHSHGYIYYPSDFGPYRHFDITNISNSKTQTSSANFFDINGNATSDFNTSYKDVAPGITDAALYGRDGLGTLMFGSAGNEKAVGGTLQNRARSSFPEFMSIAASNDWYIDDDIISYPIAHYSHPGASVFLTGIAGATQITTHIREGDYIYEQFGGTSGATPSISGLAGLVLEANPDLGWRDVQSILSHSAYHLGTSLQENESTTEFETVTWSVNTANHSNGGGFHFGNYIHS